MKILSLIISLLFINSTYAGHAHHSSTSGPISVMGDHNHEKDGWMLSYRYMKMNMDELYDGDSKIEAGDLSGRYMMVPKKMDMTMHMFGAMRGVSDDITLMVMLPYIENKMEMVKLMNNSLSNMESEGLGDLKISALHKFKLGNFSYGISIPTGTIKANNKSGVRLPYKMQLGSGTFDPKFSLTQVKNRHHDSFGVQAAAIFRLGRNSQGYSLGEKYELNGWYARKISGAWNSISKINVTRNEKIDGKDQTIEAVMNGTSRRAELSGSTEISAAAGINYDLGNGSKLALEYSIPLYQKFDGIALRTQNIITLGIQKTF